MMLTIDFVFRARGKLSQAAIKSSDITVDLGRVKRNFSRTEKPKMEFFSLYVLVGNEQTGKMIETALFDGSCLHSSLSIARSTQRLFIESVIRKAQQFFSP